MLPVRTIFTGASLAVQIEYNKRWWYAKERVQELCMVNGSYSDVEVTQTRCVGSQFLGSYSGFHKTVSLPVYSCTLYILCITQTAVDLERL